MVPTAEPDDRLIRYPPAFDVVAIAASTGGSSAYRRVLSLLPSNFSAAILAVQHRDPRFADLLPGILQRRVPLPVVAAEPGAALLPGTVHVAPADQQIAVGTEGRLVFRPPEAAARPRCSADALLTSVAAQYGPRAIAVILTGHLEDGAVGVRAIKQMGGRVIAQDPAGAEARGMPSAAIATGCIDFILTPEGIARALVSLVMAPGAAALFRVPLPSWARPAVSFALPA